METGTYCQLGGKQYGQVLKTSVPFAASKFTYNFDTLLLRACCSAPNRRSTRTLYTD